MDFEMLSGRGSQNGHNGLKWPKNDQKLKLLFLALHMFKKPLMGGLAHFLYHYWLKIGPLVTILESNLQKVISFHFGQK